VQFNLMVNSGSSMHGVHTLEIDDDTWRELGLQYNLGIESGQSALLVAGRIAETAERVINDDANGEGVIGLPGLQQLMALLTAVTVHHGAILDVRR
jgi:hypothetical protein